MRTLVWLLRALLFFTLFAFALNNSHDAVVRWFFGHEWRAPQVIIVLLAFGLGAAFGVLAMVPAPPAPVAAAGAAAGAVADPRSAGSKNASIAASSCRSVAATHSAPRGMPLGGSAATSAHASLASDP